ncbi:MAG: Modification methylase MboII [candidate division TA06 bacterium ADurb.Bin131]|uniref:Methyltransferase n=1 Tax=candidate division TA06 bacterium ADurb.Bin131 TaxID=1852827 RepID=A0A1V6CB93_UNCT6|nr:MAG: Modification methylase MboII [candidate division TA06 bacterium ADurb.Bin131]
MKDKNNILSLFDGGLLTSEKISRRGRTKEMLNRLDLYGELRQKILPLCRLKYGEVWEDPVGGHKIGVLDATKLEDVKKIVGNEKGRLIVNDPPYNVAVGNANTNALFKINIKNYLEFSKRWVQNAILITDKDAHFYIWLGADYRDNLQPFPDFIILLREFRELKPKSIITLRNQRGYGTQKNWMWVRQELLYYVKGNPEFNVGAEYTNIPRILRGYYKEVNGKITENLERSKSEYIRAGNVWVDIQQVFYRMEENVPGCYAQKPLKAIERIIMSATNEKDLVLDFFAHSGTTLIAGERLKRRVYTFDVDPIFAEITIRRLEHFRKTGKTGWQWQNPFPEIEEKKEKQKWI